MEAFLLLLVRLCKCRHQQQNNEAWQANCDVTSITCLSPEEMLHPSSSRCCSSLLFIIRFTHWGDPSSFVAVSHLVHNLCALPHLLSSFQAISHALCYLVDPLVGWCLSSFGFWNNTTDKQVQKTTILCISCKHAGSQWPCNLFNSY